MLGRSKSVDGTPDRFSLEEWVVFEWREVDESVVVDRHDLEGGSAAVQHDEPLATPRPSHDVGKPSAELLGVDGSLHVHLKLTQVVDRDNTSPC